MQTIAKGTCVCDTHQNTKEKIIGNIKEKEKPCKKIPAGTSSDNVANGVVLDIINQCTGNINVLEDNLSCQNLKIYSHFVINSNVIDVY